MTIKSSISVISETGAKVTKTAHKTAMAGVVSFLALTAVINTAPTLAQAAETTASKAIDVQVKAQPLEMALNSLAQQFGKQVVIFSKDAGDLQTKAIKGVYTDQQVLDLLLESSGLGYKYINSRTIAVGLPERLTAKTLKAGFRTVGFTSTAAYEANLGAFVEDDVEASDDTFELDEIIVTATKRAQNLQDVPLSITALTGDNLDRLGADRFEDYLAQAPGVTFASSGIVNAKPTVRGIATSIAPGQGQAPVGIYIDDMPSLTRAFPFASSDIRAFDIERIEILRGPQGTLFGSGSAGGAIRVITKKPNNEAFEAKVEVGLAAVKGGGISQNYNAMVNVPLVEDTLALRAVAYYRDEAGYIDNIVQNTTDTGGREAKGGRAMLEYAPDDAFSVRLSATYQKDKQDTIAPFGFTDPADGGIDEYSTINVADTNIEIAIYNLAVDYDFGNVGLFSSSSYGTTKAHLSNDKAALLQSILDTTEQVRSGQDIDASTFSQEIRLSSQHDGPFQWLIGGFFLDQTFEVIEAWGVPALDALPVYFEIDANTKELALFGEVNYALTDQLTLTAGARVFENTSDFANLSILFGAEDSKTADAAKESSITPKFSIAYEANDDLNFYATVAQGYRVGRANFAIPNPITGVSTPDAYESDSLWNYEIGMKSLWLEKRLKFNAAVYYIDWTNIQMPRLVNGNVITDNAGDAESKGVEIELDYTPNEWFSFGGAYAYTDAELVTAFEGSFATAGSTLPGTPKHAFSSHVEFSKDGVWGDTFGYLRVDHRYVGSNFEEIDNADSFIIESHHLLNVRAGIEWDNYELVAYANNIFDERTVLQFSDADSFNKAHGQYTLPRTIGLTFRAGF